MRRGSLVAGELARPVRRLDLGEMDDATLDLRDRLLRDDDDVVRARAHPHELAASTSSAAEIVALLELRDPAERDDAKLPGQASPVTRMPACPRVALVQVHDDRREALERARARERPGVERAARGEPLRRARARAPSRPDRRRRRRRPRRAARSAPRLDAASECSPATTGPSSSAWIRSASEVASGDGKNAALREAELRRDGEHRRRADRVREARGPCRAPRRRSTARTTRSAPRDRLVVRRALARRARPRSQRHAPRRASR